METAQARTRKIFGVGFHKTATTSLGAALELLGQRVCGPVGYRKPDIAETLRETAFEVVDDYDAFHNNPWSILFKELDERYPDSQFILTKRDSTKWINSVVKHFGAESTPMRELIYGRGHGAPKGNEALYVDIYERHNADVIEYFKNRGKLLVMDVTAGDGWEKLCAFLGQPIPEVAFPYLNISPDLMRTDAVSRAEVMRKHGHLLGGLPYGKVHGKKEEQ